MIDFFFEDTRAFILLIFAVVCFAGALIIRAFTLVKPIPADYSIELNGLTFQQTSPESPEQYDVYLGETMIGYVRYRFGNLTAEYPDAGCELVLERAMRHETGQLTDEERGRWFPVIAKRLQRKRKRDPHLH